TLSLGLRRGKMFMEMPCHPAILDTFGRKFVTRFLALGVRRDAQRASGRARAPSKQASVRVQEGKPCASESRQALVRERIRIMPPEPTNPLNDPILSRQLYDLILKIATVPVLLFLLWLSWVIINRLMSPAWRQERRNREIRRAVAARQALLAEKQA